MYYSDQLITLEGVVSDVEDAATDLTVLWSSGLDGDLDVDISPSDDGSFASATYLNEGEHFLTLTATDSTDKSGSDNVTITVSGPSPSQSGAEASEAWALALRIPCWVASSHVLVPGGDRLPATPCTHFHVPGLGETSKDLV